MNRRWLTPFVLAGGIWIGCPSTASAQASCTISVTSVNFGTYNVFATTDTTSTGSVTYNCNQMANNISVALSRGSSSTFTPRTLRNGTEILQYNLYRNAGYTQIWGDGTGGTSPYTRNNPPNGTDVTITIYGQIPAGQDVRVGTYSDTVSATINF